MRKNKFESSKPKETGNSGGDHEEDGNRNNDNGKNGGNEKPSNGKWKLNNKLKGLVNCFLFYGPLMVKTDERNLCFLLSKGMMSQIEHQ